MPSLGLLLTFTMTLSLGTSVFTFEEKGNCMLSVIISKVGIS